MWGEPLTVPIKFELKRSRRKTLSMQIKEGELVVKAPFHVSYQEIDSWVQSKSSWVSKQLAAFDHRLSDKPAIKAGGFSYHLGERVSLQFKQGTANVHLIDGQLSVSASLENHHQVLKRWVARQTRNLIEPLCYQIASDMNVQDRLQGVRYRFTKSKWGHCTRDGVVQFHSGLSMAPMEIIHYIICHELSHLLHMDHSPKFWAQVEAFCPDYHAHRKALNQLGYRYTL